MKRINVAIIYSGGHVPDLGIATYGDLEGWLVYRHPDGEWVTLTDLREYVHLMTPGDQAQNARLREELANLKVCSHCGTYGHSEKVCEEGFGP